MGKTLGVWGLLLAVGCSSSAEPARESTDAAGIETATANRDAGTDVRQQSALATPEAGADATGVTDIRDAGPADTSTVEACVPQLCTDCEPFPGYDGGYQNPCEWPGWVPILCQQNCAPMQAQCGPPWSESDANSVFNGCTFFGFSNVNVSIDPVLACCPQPDACVPLTNPCEACSAANAGCGSIPNGTCPSDFLCKGCNTCPF